MKTTTPEQPNWLAKVHNAQDELRLAAKSLDSLAGAFYRTGNPEVGNELSDTATTIRVSANAIADAIGNNLSDQVEQSQNLVGSVMSAAIQVLTKDRNV